MSISLTVDALCKHVLKIDVNLFGKRKAKGSFKNSVGTIVTKVWDNLEKLFSTSATVVKQNVTKKDMHGAVRTLLTGKATDSVVLYRFSDNRETREGNNSIAKTKLNDKIKVYDCIND